jgi:hypothetical protein
LSLDSTIAHRFSLTTVLSSTCSDQSLSITNVYAPADHRETNAFLDELLSLRPLISGPWLIVGDFNLVRSVDDKSNGIINTSLVNAFNDAIHSLGVQELPLLDIKLNLVFP